MIPLGILSAQLAGVAGGAYDLLETTVLGTSASSVTFSSIPQDYKHLQIRVVGRANSSLNNKAGILNFNSDTGSNYAFHYIRGNGSSVVSDANTSRAFIRAWFNPDSADTANQFGAAVVDILDYTNSSKNTTTRSLSGKAGGNNGVELFSGLWMNTNAVISIAISLEDGVSYVAGSRFSLYGVKA